MTLLDIILMSGFLTFAYLMMGMALYLFIGLNLDRTRTPWWASLTVALLLGFPICLILTVKWYVYEPVQGIRKRIRHRGT